MPPIVAVNERIIGSDVPTVTVDGYHAAKEVIRYLMGLGHTKIGRIAGPSDWTSAAADRLEISGNSQRRWSGAKLDFQH